MMKRSIVFWGLALGALLLASGCASSGVTVKPEFTDEQRASAERLITHCNEFDIYGYQWGGQVPAVLLFDLKNDNKRLVVGNNWHKIASQEELLAGLQRASLWKAQAIPRLSSVIGPDGKVWGYVMTAYGQISASVVDENTINVSPPRDPRPPQ